MNNSVIKGISFENFRVFKDKSDFELAPITILTGTNSSGKSSIIKGMKLMHCFCLNRSANLAEFGGFENTVNNKSSDREIVITHRVQKEGYSYFFGTFLVEYVFVKKEGTSDGQLKSLSVYVENGQTTSLLYQANQNEETFFNEDYVTNEYIPKFKSFNEELEEYKKIVKHDVRIVEKGFYENDGSWVPDQLEPPAIYEKYCQSRGINYEKTKAFETLNFLFNDIITNIEENWFVGFSLTKTDLSEIKRIILYLSIEQINYFYKNMYFIDALRSGAQREYILNSNNGFFEDLVNKCINEKWLEEKAIKDKILKWINDFDIAEDIDFKETEKDKIQIIIIKDGKPMNMADLGFGVFHLIHLFLNLSPAINWFREWKGQWDKMEDGEKMLNIVNGKPTVIIEEPESHLHPKLQSNLAELFAENIDKANFIVETHSEYLIRKLQYLTAKGDIKPDESVIHYIGSPNPMEREYGEEQVRTIRIKPNGQLSKPFESGFLDEADNLALLLIDYPLN